MPVLQPQTLSCFFTICVQHPGRLVRSACGAFCAHDAGQSDEQQSRSVSLQKKQQTFRRATLLIWA